jgi:DNA repair photolyase
VLKPISNPPSPWESTHVEYLGEPPDARLEVFEEEAGSILAENESPDVGFRWSINPYRGCFHACAYCYSRTSHEYLGFGAGTDFDRKIVVKVNAPALLRAALSRRAWKGETIIFSGNTDCYQPLEAVYELTRRCLEVCAEFRNPVAIITKGALVRRDVDLLARMSREGSASVALSIPFSDDAMSRAIEPNASLPSQRFETLRLLSEAGIRTGVGVAPVIPGLNDSQISTVLERARSAGATSAFMTLVRLAGQTLPVFRERLELALPDRARKVWSAIQQTRGGKFNESQFGLRMHGVGPRWEAIRSLFDVECRRLGFNEERVGEEGEEEETTFRRPGGAQWDLFGPER